MPEAASPAPEPSLNASAPARVLLVMIVGTPDTLDDIITGLLDLGVPGTVVEARGLMSLMREEMPIFSGLAAMLPETGGSRVVLSFTTAEMAAQVFAFLISELEPKHRPVAFTVPIDAVLGEQAATSGAPSGTSGSGG